MPDLLTDLARVRELMEQVSDGDYLTRLANGSSVAVECADFLRTHASGIEAMARDAARLDWLADRDNPIGNVQLPNVCVMNNMDSLRGAIDEAMKLDPEAYAAIDAMKEAGREYGMTFDTQAGRIRNWYVGADGVKRWADNDEPVEDRDNGG